MPEPRFAPRVGRVMVVLAAVRACSTRLLAAGFFGSRPRPRRRGRRGRAVRLFSVVAGLVMAVSLAALAGVPSQPASAALAGPARVGRVGAAVPRLRPVIRTALRHGLSPPLRSMRSARPPSGGKVRVIPNPNPLQARAEHAARPLAPARMAGVQRQAGTAAMPGFQQDFEGIANTSPGNTCQCLPPDTNGAVGPGDYVQTVNTALAVWSKQGQLLFGPMDLATLWQGFGGACDPAADPSAADGGDPVVLYDEQANRWFISQLSYPQAVNGSGGYHECIAVSQTGDPAGAYYRYDFLFSNTTLNDYPKYGVWPDAYYQSVNDFANASSFTGVTVTAFDRAAMLAGQPARSVSFTLANANDAYLLPANWEGGALGQFPPAGAPDPYVMSCDANTGGPCTSGQIDEWDFHVNWASPSSSTFGNNGAPSTTVPTQDFNGDLCGFSRNCIPQPGTGQGIDPGSDKLMYQAAYRTIGGTPTIALSQTVNTSTSGNQGGINWYELADGGSGWSIADQGTYAPNSNDRFQPSANIDVSGDIAVGYSVSSSAAFPSIAVAGRLASDPPGQLAQGEATLIAGGGSQTNIHNRWGDYSAMQVDPANGCTFWYTSEYYAATSDANWQTRIGSFTFPSCSATPPGHVTGTVTDASTGQPLAGATVSALGETVTTAADGGYTLTLPPGTAQVTVTDYAYQAQAASVTVTTGQTVTQNFQLTPTPRETVSGTVTAGSGAPWPLYARVSWSDGNGHGGAAYTTPATGKYSLSLLENGSYTLTVTPLYPGYTAPPATTVTVDTSNVTQDFTAGVNLTACTAIGYHAVYTGTTQPFKGTSAPSGWRVTNIDLHIPGYAHTPGWVFNDPGHRGNHTGGAGGFAIVDSDHDGQFHYQDTQLTSPAMNLSADKTPAVQFATDLVGATNSTATVAVSTDGGNTWTRVWRNARTPGVPGPATVLVLLPRAAGKASVKVRFTYTGQWSQYWELDNVFLGNRVCTQQAGGLLVGRVADSSETGINGATVASVTTPGDKATTMATPGDTGINGGLYDLFTTATGSQQFTASDTGYTPSTQTAAVTAGKVSTLNFTLTTAIALRPAHTRINS